MLNCSVLNWNTSIPHHPNPTYLPDSSISFSLTIFINSPCFLSTNPNHLWDICIKIHHFLPNNYCSYIHTISLTYFWITLTRILTNHEYWKNIKPGIMLLHVSPESKLSIESLVTGRASESTWTTVNGLHVVPLNRPCLEWGPTHLTQECPLLWMCCLGCARCNMILG